MKLILLQPADNLPLAHSLTKPVSMYKITVGDPQKVGDPISAHIIYTVHTKVIYFLFFVIFSNKQQQTSNTAYRKSEFSVLRRYSDFLWLYDTLCNNNPGVIVPSLPEKNSLGRFQDAFVENRRLALNKCIQKIANHPGLCNDPDLRLFLESDNFTLDVSRGFHSDRQRAYIHHRLNIEKLMRVRAYYLSSVPQSQVLNFMKRMR